MVDVVGIVPVEEEGERVRRIVVTTVVTLGEGEDEDEGVELTDVDDVPVEEGTRVITV